MLTGRKYRLELDEHQRRFAESIGGATRHLWNIALEQRRYYRARGEWVSFAEQCRQLTEVRAEYEWMRAVPVHCLQQVLRDLDNACKRHGVRRLNWKSRSKTLPSFRFPDGARLAVERLNRKWGRVKLPKFGWVSFRMSRRLDGVVRSATLSRDGKHWFGCSADSREVSADRIGDKWSSIRSRTSTVAQGTAEPTSMRSVRIG
nr:helix-turn-helix domain-containing protein [Glycomyces dulcitolivorans]